MLPLTAILLLALPVQDPVFSGPQAGETVKPLTGIDVRSNESVEVAFGGTPVLVVAIHGMERIVAAYVRRIDDYGDLNRDRFRTVFYFLCSSADESQAKMTQVVKSLSLKNPLLLSVHGEEGEGDKAFNKDVLVTAFFAGADSKVLFNQALISPSAKQDGDALLAFLDKQDEADPDRMSEEELRREVRRLRRELAEIRERKKREEEKGGRDGRGEEMRSDEPIGDLIRALIQKTLTEERAREILAKIDALVAKDRAAKDQMKTSAKAIVENKYGTPFVQEAVKKYLR